MFHALLTLTRRVRVPLTAASLEEAVREAQQTAQRMSNDRDATSVTEIQNTDTGMSVTPAATQVPPPGMVDVHWSVRIPASSPSEGASLARCMQFDPTSLATVYRVCDDRGICQLVDTGNASDSPPH